VVLADGSVIAVNGAGASVSRVSGSGRVEWTWRVPGGARSIRAQPVVSGDGEVVVADAAGLLHRLDAVSGQLLASVSLGGRAVGAPALSGSGHVFVVARGQVGQPSVLHKVALSARAADQGWRRPVCGEDALVLDGADAGLVLTRDGGVLVPCALQGSLLKVDGASGALRWSFNLSSAAATAGPAPAPVPASAGLGDAAPWLRGAPVAAAASGDVFLALTASLVARVAGDTGAARWVRALPGAPLGPIALAANGASGLVLVRSAGATAKLLRFAADTGAVMASATVAGDGAAAFGPAIDATGTVFVAAGGSVLALNGTSLALIKALAITGNETAVGAPQLSGAGVVVSTNASCVTMLGLASATASPTSSIAPTTVSAPTPNTSGGASTDAPTVGLSTVGGEKWPAASIAIIVVLAVTDTVLAAAIAYKKRQQSTEYSKGMTEPESPHN
jgi:outer membrane protein assembly factor BamB